jgi:hypothetical protein
MQHFEVPITKFGRNEELLKAKSSFKEETIILEAKKTNDQNDLETSIKKKQSLNDTKSSKSNF